MSESTPFRILFICTGNRTRSQMAHGWLNHLRGGHLEVESAGTQPKGVRPLAIQVMTEVGIDLSGHTSDHVDRYAGDAFDFVLTVCDSGREQCLVFPGAKRQVHRAFDDPDMPGSSETELLETIHRIQDEIDIFSRELPATELQP